MKLDRASTSHPKVSLIALCTIVLLGASTTACGGAGKGETAASPISTTASTAPGAATAANATHASIAKDTNDGDEDLKVKDDDFALRYGAAAGENDRQAIIALLRRYYATAANGNGASACSLIDSALVETIPQEYGRSPGPPSLRGKTCSVVMSKLFKQRHRELAADAAGLEVTGVRIEGKNGFVLLRFPAVLRLNYMRLSLQRGVWKVNGLLAQPLT